MLEEHARFKTIKHKYNKIEGLDDEGAGKGDAATKRVKYEITDGGLAYIEK